jgi:rhodanese-related sulfurtransferase
MNMNFSLWFCVWKNRMFKEKGENMPEIRQAQPQDIKLGDLILDVRTPAERAEISLDRPFWAVELNQLNPAKFIKDYNLNDKKRLYILCRTGHRAAVAAAMFQKAGFENVAVIAGGIENAKNFLPVVRSGHLPIERQVRISAGIIIVAGIGLGLAVHQIFYALPMLIGIGLLCSGITNWCGMSKALQYMPWNRD